MEACLVWNLIWFETLDLVWKRVWFGSLCDLKIGTPVATLPGAWRHRVACCWDVEQPTSKQTYRPPPSPYAPLPLFLSPTPQKEAHHHHYLTDMTATLAPATGAAREEIWKPDSGFHPASSRPLPPLRDTPTPPPLLHPALPYPQPPSSPPPPATLLTPLLLFLVPAVHGQR